MEENKVRNDLKMIGEIANAFIFIAVGFSQRNNSQPTRGFSQKIALLSLAKARIFYFIKVHWLKPTAMKKNNLIFKQFLTFPLD
jgi:hypothetical protein